MKSISRNLRIFKSRLNALSFIDTCLFLKTAFFKKERILIFCKELNSEIGNTQHFNLDREIIKGITEDLEQARKSNPSPPWEFCCDLYDGVKDFFIFKDQGTIRHISWLYLKDHPNRLINLSQEECEIKFCLTVSGFRGKGIYPAVLLKIQQFLREKGYKRVYICSKKENVSSIRGIEKAGFTLVTSINFMKILGLQVSRKYASNY